MIYAVAVRGICSGDAAELRVGPKQLLPRDRPARERARGQQAEHGILNLLLQRSAQTELGRKDLIELLVWRDEADTARSDVGDLDQSRSGKLTLNIEVPAVELRSPVGGFDESDA